MWYIWSIEKYPFMKWEKKEMKGIPNSCFLPFDTSRIRKLGAMQDQLQPPVCGIYIPFPTSLASP